MSYQVIARKWRPQRFDDVVGQQAVTRTLRNALSSGRLAKAFVFAGPRELGPEEPSGAARAHNDDAHQSQPERLKWAKRPPQTPTMSMMAKG